MVWNECCWISLSNCYGKKKRKSESKKLSENLTCKLSVWAKPWHRQESMLLPWDLPWKNRRKMLNVVFAGTLPGEITWKAPTSLGASWGALQGKGGKKFTFDVRVRYHLALTQTSLQDSKWGCCWKHGLYATKAHETWKKCQTISFWWWNAHWLEWASTVQSWQPPRDLTWPKVWKQETVEFQEWRD